MYIIPANGSSLMQYLRQQYLDQHRKNHLCTKKALVEIYARPEHNIALHGTPSSFLLYSGCTRGRRDAWPWLKKKKEDAVMANRPTLFAYLHQQERVLPTATNLAQEAKRNEEWGWGCHSNCSQKSNDVWSSTKDIHSSVHRSRHPRSKRSHWPKRQPQPWLGRPVPRPGPRLGWRQTSNLVIGQGQRLQARVWATNEKCNTEWCTEHCWGPKQNRAWRQTCLKLGTKSWVYSTRKASINTCPDWLLTVKLDSSLTACTLK